MAARGTGAAGDDLLTTTVLATDCGRLRWAPAMNQGRLWRDCGPTQPISISAATRRQNLSAQERLSRPVATWPWGALLGATRYRYEVADCFGARQP